MPVPAGSKYPAPDTLRWLRPMYDDPPPVGGSGEAAAAAEEEEEEEEDDEFGPSAGHGGDEPEVYNEISAPFQYFHDL